MSTTDNRPAEGDRAARWSERTKASVTDLAGVPVPRRHRRVVGRLSAVDRGRVLARLAELAQLDRLVRERPFGRGWS